MPDRPSSTSSFHRLSASVDHLAVQFPEVLIVTNKGVVSWLCSPRVKSRVTEPSSLSQIYKKHKTLVPLKDCLLRMSFETLFVDALSRRPKIADIIHIPLKKRAQQTR